MNLENALVVATKLAKQAGELINSGLQNGVQFTKKTDVADRVTATDTACEALIVEGIKQAFPTCGILGEESASYNLEAEYRFVIDPLDGTSNFTNGIPFCGTSIALERNGVSVMGVLHFPALGQTYTAIKGKGAYCNGQLIAVKPVATLQTAVVAELFSDRVHRGTTVPYPPSMAYRRFGSAITSLAYLASGRVHATALTCKRWDIAAAEVIIVEAGGLIEYGFKDASDMRSTLQVIAASPLLMPDFKKFVTSNGLITMLP